MKSLTKLWNKYRFPSYFFIGGIVLTILVLYGLYYFGIVDLVGEEQSKATCPKVEVAEETSKKKLLVDIRGAVNTPGVYEFKEGALVNEVLTLAGGLKSNSDNAWIDQNINFARALVDREKLYFPYKVEVVTASVSASTKPSNQKINLNTASQSDLEGLPGIGPSTAEKIMQGRPYKAVSDLLEVKGIGNSLLEKIKDLVET